ncbi:MAG: hypothetical protein IJK31_04440 [Ruminococcus sp.]|nr:hypothetical protein [Ruminococcus sp.]
MKGRSFLAGIAAAFAAWGLLTLGDCFDEYVLNEDSAVGAFIFLTIPIAMFIFYIRHYRRSRPEINKLISWFAGYSTLFLAAWAYVCSGNGHFFIPQKSRTDWLDFNGIEYLLYGFTAYFAFLLLCAVFHLIVFIMKKAKKQ